MSSAGVPAITEATELTPATVIAGLGALAHETRLALFRELVRKGAAGQDAGTLARHLQVPPQTLSFHLREMSHAGLVRARRQGRNIFYAVDFDHAQRLIDYLVASCCADVPAAVARPVPAARIPRRSNRDD